MEGMKRRVYLIFSEAVVKKNREYAPRKQGHTS